MPLAACPAARVVYVDHDPVVLAHARAMLHSVPGATIIGQDLTEPEQILADPALRRPQGEHRRVQAMLKRLAHGQVGGQ